MQVVKRISRYVLDRRPIAGGVIAGVIAAFLGIFGVRALTSSAPVTPNEDLVYLVSTALDRAQAYLETRIPNYRPARVVLFEASTDTQCGRGLATSGPFYCPADEMIYVDLAFLRAIRGDLARAYVIEHELGHHVQTVTGRFVAGGYTMELYADCLAGELMRVEREAGHLEHGDIESALAEAAAVGDDRIRPGSSPETWTHGSSDQRVAAVLAGLSGVGCRP